MRRDIMKRIQRPVAAERERRPKKRNMIPAIALMAATTLGGAFSAYGFSGSFKECDMPSQKRVERDKHFNRMAEELKLTNSQREQIKTIIKAEKEQTDPLREKLIENRRMLRKSTESQKFDEAEIKAIAATQAGIQADLIVSNARLHNRVNSILSQEQRELARKFHSSMDGRKGNH